MKIKLKKGDDLRENITDILNNKNVSSEIKDEIEKAAIRVERGDVVVTVVIEDNGNWSIETKPLYFIPREFGFGRE